MEEALYRGGMREGGRKRRQDGRREEEEGGREKRKRRERGREGGWREEGSREGGAGRRVGEREGHRIYEGMKGGWVLNIVNLGAPVYLSTD